MTILNKSVLKFQTSPTNTSSVWEISDDNLLKKKGYNLTKSSFNKWTSCWYKNVSHITVYLKQIV